MASPFVIQTSSLFFLFLFLSHSNAQPTSSSRPHMLVAPVTKDAATLQYLTTIKQKTPLASESLVIHLGAEYVVVDCDKGFVSSSYRTINCFSNQCDSKNGVACLTKPGRKGYKSSQVCVVYSRNDLNGEYTDGEFISDVVSIQSCVNGSNPGPYVTIRKFSFGCVSTSFLAGFAKGVAGIASFGRTRHSIPSQFTFALRIPRMFAMCLPSTTDKGVMFFGGGPYKMQPGIDIGSSLTYTPLQLNTNDPTTPEYYIQVKSINIDGKQVPINTTCIVNWFGGRTKISTITPYTAMHTLIYKRFTTIFINKAESMNITRVTPVAPFGACFETKSLISTRVGYRVPTINFILHSKKVVWTIFGSNSMVQVSDDVSCLAFVDGGNGHIDSSLVLGGYQLENNLLEFNLAKSRLGFSSTLLARQTTCSNFNFTSKV